MCSFGIRSDRTASLTARRASQHSASFGWRPKRAQTRQRVESLRSAAVSPQTPRSLVAWLQLDGVVAVPDGVEVPRLRRSVVRVTDATGRAMMILRRAGHGRADSQRGLAASRWTRDGAFIERRDEPRRAPAGQSGRDADCREEHDPLASSPECSRRARISTMLTGSALGPR
jgi:hypothetical protein